MEFEEDMQHKINRGRIRFSIFVTTSILILSTHQAFPGSQSDVKLNRDMTAQFQRILQRIPSTEKDAVTDAVKSFENQISSSEEKDQDYCALAQTTIRSFSLEGLSQLDVSETVFLVMMMAIEDMDDDIRMIMSEIKAMMQAKQKLRELIKELYDWIRNEMENRTDGEDIDTEKVSGKESEPDTTEGTLPNHMGKKIPGVMTTPNYKVEYFRAPVVKRIPDLEKMSENEVREELSKKKKNLVAMERRLVVMDESVRLLLDRRSRLIQIVSELLEEMSTTNDNPSGK